MDRVTLIILILLAIMIYKIHKLTNEMYLLKVEKMTNECVGADMQTISTLATLAKNISTGGGITIPGDVTIKGDLTVDSSSPLITLSQNGKTQMDFNNNYINPTGELVVNGNLVVTKDTHLNENASIKGNVYFPNSGIALYNNTGSGTTPNSLDISTGPNAKGNKNSRLTRFYTSNSTYKNGYVEVETDMYADTASIYANTIKPSGGTVTIDGNLNVGDYTKGTKNSIQVYYLNTDSINSLDQKAPGQGTSINVMQKMNSLA